MTFRNSSPNKLPAFSTIFSNWPINNSMLGISKSVNALTKQLHDNNNITYSCVKDIRGGTVHKNYVENQTQ